MIYDLFQGVQPAVVVAADLHVGLADTSTGSGAGVHQVLAEALLHPRGADTKKAGKCGYSEPHNLNQNGATPGFEMFLGYLIPAPLVLGVPTQTRLHTPNAVTYHDHIPIRPRL